jgi:NAT, N-acetyltransferase, of N-acetylglutamate synthase
LALDQDAAVETLLSFLENVGAPAEAQMYLRLFRGVPPGRFAVVLPTDAVLREGTGTFAEQLALLRSLGIFVSVAIGAFDAPTSLEVSWLFDALRDAELPSVKIVPGPDAFSETERAFERGAIPVTVFRERDEKSPPLPTDAAIAPELEEMLERVSPRKIIVLRGAGGLGPHGVGRLEIAPGHVLLGSGSGLSVINLRSDQAPLIRGGFLKPLEVAWVRRARSLLELLWTDTGPPVTFTIASPLSLLRELFTVRGEGTLVRLGAEISRFSGFDEVNVERLGGLLESGFGKRLREGFFQRTPLEIHLEKGTGASF